MSQSAPLRIDLWLWPLACGSDLSNAADLLSEDERRRAARFIRPELGASWTMARGGLRQILAKYLDQSPASIVFDYGSHGRPQLRGEPGLSFNLSHSGGYAALAVGEAVRFGLDIEAPRTVEPAVAERFFSPAEQAELAALAQADWLAGFFSCWTRKEAVIKAFGLGLSMPLDSFDVSLTPGAAPLLRRLDGGEAGDWQICHLTPHPDLIGALAVQNRGRDLHLVPRRGWPL